jgi:diguanylate cyclase (GGDEF)-like protein
MLGREAGILLAIWGAGALMLVMAIGFSHQSDAARRRQLLVAQMRQTVASAPWIAFNRAGASEQIVNARLSDLGRSLSDDADQLRALGDDRYAPRVEAAIDEAIAASRRVAALASAGQDTKAIATIDRSIDAGGPGALLWARLDDADTAYRHEAERAERNGGAASILLTAIVLLAFSLALVRSLRARMRAERLSSANEVLLEQSRLEACTDALTGMRNRRALFEDAGQLLAQGAVSLGIYDLDGFKLYNDSFGHPAGDALLAHLGRQLSAAVEGHGTAYRMGGDEFCVLTASADATRVHAAAAQALSERGDRFAIACSYGVATVPGEASTLEQALQLADQRLYGDKERSRPLQTAQVKDALIQVLAEQNGDLVTHLGRVALLAVETAVRLGLPASEVARIRLAAELHDIGKSAVPRAILEKQEPLDETEFAYLRQHSVIGERIVAAAPSLAEIAPLVRGTHERPDGTGYPDGLRLAEIPLGSRVISVVDAFDAMTADRPYQARRSVDQALAELRRGAGTQFDPRIVSVFCALVEERDERAWQLMRAAAEQATPASASEARRADRRANRA